MRDHGSLEELRRDPAEWRRRGLTPPDDLAAIVRSRVGHGSVADPTYADFFAG